MENSSLLRAMFACSSLLLKLSGLPESTLSGQLWGAVSLPPVGFAGMTVKTE